MKKAIDYTPLIEGLQRYRESGKTFVSLAKDANNITSSATIGRYANNQVDEPSLTIWLALHLAAPNYIPVPPITERIKHAGDKAPLSLQQSSDVISDEEIKSLGRLRKIPVFDAGAGANCFWGDNGYLVGISDEYVYLPHDETEAKTFAVRVHGNSMAPKIEDGDRVVVRPDMGLNNGDMVVYCNHEDSTAEKLVRRYYEYPEQGMIFLRPDNRDEGFEIVLNIGEENNCKICRVSHIIKKV